MTDFVLDLARNGELQSRISRMGSLSTESARVYAAQIVDALGYMHSKGVIHRLVSVVGGVQFMTLTLPRDLKPENLLLDDAFRIKITDFGTGKILDSGGRSLPPGIFRLVTDWSICTQASARRHSWARRNMYLRSCSRIARRARGAP